MSPDPGPRRSPQPSLLAALLADPLDPGYAAAAARRRATASHHAHAARTTRAWAVAGVLVVGLVLGVAAATTSAAAPAGEVVRAGLAQEATDAQGRVDDLAAQRAGLAARAQEQRSRVLDGGSEGRAANDALQQLQVAAGVTPVAGPALRVTLSDTGSGDATSGARGGTVLDRDLQLVVNALWSGGAEAVAVGGVRLSPQASIRQAGGAVLVDDQPVFTPYEVVGIGDVGRLETTFVRSEAYVRLSAVAQVYGLGFATERVERAELPAATGTDLAATGRVGGGR
ncbi:hypothetical protein GCM10027047_19420 [Rhodococcus aerolatus]